MNSHDTMRRLFLAMQAGALTPTDQREASLFGTIYVQRAEAVERDRDRIVQAAQEDAELAERHARLNVVPLRRGAVQLVDTWGGPGGAA